VRTHAPPLPPAWATGTIPSIRPWREAVVRRGLAQGGTKAALDPLAARAVGEP
jgi:hypothetical protein